MYQLSPLFTYNLWGGKKLSKIYQKKSTQYGEAWILSCLKEMNSPISKGKSLKDLFNQNKNIVKKGYKGDFPLLIKLIDANDDLSIQVHPEVKTEFWHVLNKKPSHLYMGFKKNTNRSQIEKILKNGDITKSLNHVAVKEGDSFLIKPGTIHAIGKHTFLIEIQRSADVTYRLYDFNRVDKYGKKRELHIAQALKVINYQKLPIKRNKPSKVLVKCPFFTVYQELIKKSQSFIADDKSFHSLTVLSGKGNIELGKQIIKLKPFDTVFVPASEGKYTIKGQLKLIRVTL
ncbi:MAG: class I mannose-6-phosphate isomerase [Bacilli bacterium]|nr:class I mannose-6-phosphate isomerase [Bacilli bacterium]